MEPKQQPPYPLRMPQDLREALEKEAAAGKRSLNAEVVMRLELTIAREPEKLNSLRSSRRVLSRQMLELEGQLMVADEIRHAREQRRREEISRTTSEKNLAPVHAAVEQAERVVNGLKKQLQEIQARYNHVIAQLPADDHDHLHNQRSDSASK